jgi:hypothetical protein
MKMRSKKGSSAGTPVQFLFSTMEKTGPFVAGIFLIFTVVGIYWRVMKYPFIQDDWCLLNSLVKDGGTNFLTNAISSYQAKFYRPVSQTMIAILYFVFGLNPSGYHVVALVLHTVNSFLVVLLAKRFMPSLFLSWIAGFLYAAAVTVQVDPVFWIVGMNDLCAATFFLLAFIFFFRKQRLISLAWYIFAFLSKESVIILPLILFLVKLFFDAEKLPWSRRVENSLRSVWQYGVLSGFYIAFRYYGISSLPVTSLVDQYEIHFYGIHLLKNLFFYGEWFVESFAFQSDLPPGIILLFWAVPVVAFFLCKKGAPERTRICIFGFWGVTGLLPVLFLTNHPFRYYLIYSLPALLMMMLLSVTVIAGRFSPGGKIVKGLLILGTMVIIVGSAYYLSALDRQGFNGAETIVGSNNLIRKGALITTVRDDMMRQAPNLPQGAVIIFDWAPVGSFCIDAGPQLWYKDFSLRVFSRDEVNFDSSGVYTMETISSDPGHSAGRKLYFDPGKIFIFRIDEGRFYKEELSRYLDGSM